MSNGTPSPSDPLPSRSWRLYLEDMLEFCQMLQSYTAGQTLASWSADAMRRDASLHRLALIGEAATRVPMEIRQMAPDIPWRQIVGVRNRLKHAYPATDASVIWAIVSNELPGLAASLGRLLEQLPPDPA